MPLTDDDTQRRMSDGDEGDDVDAAVLREYTLHEVVGRGVSGGRRERGGRLTGG